MYIRRYLEEKILNINDTFKVLYLGGPRQVGKTTLLVHLAGKLKMHYVSLDDLNARRLALNDPELFLQRYKAPLLIDEVQYAPSLFPYIKIEVDRQQKNGRYWMTGSQQFAVMKNVKESLAGRVGVLSLLGFSVAEVDELPRKKNSFLPGGSFNGRGYDLHTAFSYITKGFFPVLWRNKNAPDAESFYNSYLQTYLDRDLRDIFHVAKISAFHSFLQLCAARTGQMLNISDLARDAGVSVHAAREWLGILEASMQIYLLRPYYKNFSKRLIKAPKMYFLDTGMAAFLTKWKTPETLMNGAMAGAFFETFAVTEILKSYLNRGADPPLYYFRDKEGHEVDLIMERDNKLYPVEIKMAANPSADATRGISYLRKKLPNVAEGAVVCLARNSTPMDRQTDILPVSAIA